MPEAEDKFEQIRGQLEPDGTVLSQMFGMPVLKANGKTFAGLYHGDMTFKLTGDKHAEALALSGSKLFDPSGRDRPMKEWVVVNQDHIDQWDNFAVAAMAYVLELNK